MAEGSSSSQLKCCLTALQCIVLLGRGCLILVTSPRGPAQQSRTHHAISVLSAFFMPVLNDTFFMPSAGDNLKYTEVMGMPNMFAAAVVTFLSAVGYALIAAWPLTPLWRRVLPKAGEGEYCCPPSLWAHEQACWLAQQPQVELHEASCCMHAEGLTWLTS